MKTTDRPVVVEQNFNTSAEQLWNAITLPQEMRLWFFDNIPDFKPEAKRRGFTIRNFFDSKSYPLPG